MITGLMLGLGLSASSGFRIFIPLLISNLAARIGWVTVGEDFLWMASPTATLVLLVATVLEIGAYYIPFIDNLLDTIALPSAVVAGTLLTSQFLTVSDPLLQWGLALVAGGGVAGTVQAGTSLLRLGSSKFTLGTGNAAVSTTENIFSSVLSLFAIWLPLLIGGLVLFGTIVVLRRLIRKKTV
jgi:hypothetical protein